MSNPAIIAIRERLNEKKAKLVRLQRLESEALETVKALVEDQAKLNDEIYEIEKTLIQFGQRA